MTITDETNLSMNAGRLNRSDGIHKAEHERTDDHAEDTQRNFALAEECAADEERCQRNRNHTGADIDADRLLRLREQAA